MEEDINLIEYFRILLKWKKLMAFAAFFITVGGLLVVYTKTPHYRTTVVVQLDNNRADSGQISTRMDPMGMGDPWKGLWESPSLLDTIEVVLQSRTIAERVIDRWNLIEFFFGGGRNDPAKMEAAVRKLKTRVKFSHNKTKKTMTVQVVLKDPQLAQGVANEFIVQLQKIVEEGVAQSVEQRRFSVQKGLEKEQEKLFESGKQFREFLDPGENTSRDWQSFLERRAILWKLTSDFSLQHEKTKVDAMREVVPLRVIDFARLPEVAFWPDRKLNIFFSFLGGIVGALFLGFLAEYVQRYGLLTRVITILRQEGPRENF